MKNRYHALLLKIKTICSQCEENQVGLPEGTDWILLLLYNQSTRSIANCVRYDGEHGKWQEKSSR